MEPKTKAQLECAPGDARSLSDLGRTYYGGGKIGPYFRSFSLNSYHYAPPGSRPCSPFLPMSCLPSYFTVVSSPNTYNSGYPTSCWSRLSTPTKADLAYCKPLKIMPTNAARGLNRSRMYAPQMMENLSSISHAPRYGSLSPTGS